MTDSSRLSFHKCKSRSPRSLNILPLSSSVAACLTSLRNDENVKILHIVQGISAVANPSIELDFHHNFAHRLHSNFANKFWEMLLGLILIHYPLCAIVHYLRHVIGFEVGLAFSFAKNCTLLTKAWSLSREAHLHSKMFLSIAVNGAYKNNMAASNAFPFQINAGFLESIENHGH